MVRAAALVSGDGARLQAILDSMYFKEIPNFELVAVISTARDVYAMKRALNAHVPAYVVALPERDEPQHGGGEQAAGYGH